jgi:hypothetical protein
MSQRPYSETQGRRRGLEAEGLIRILFPKLDQLLDEEMFTKLGHPEPRLQDESTGEVSLAGSDPVEVETFFLERVRSTRPWQYLLQLTWSDRLQEPPTSVDEVLDFVQALYEIAAIDVMEEDEDSTSSARARGRARMREVVDPVLNLLEPALALAGDGAIVQVTPSVFEPLVEHPLPADVATEDIAEDVGAAVHQFRRRHATAADRHGACVRLAGVLESLREQGEIRPALGADEGRLFEIANQFAIRHRNARQRTEYDQEVFHEWIFYVQLAAIRLAARLRARDQPDR